MNEERVKRKLSGILSADAVGYLQWLSTTDLEEDMRYTVEHHLKH